MFCFFGRTSAFRGLTLDKASSGPHSTGRPHSGRSGRQRAAGTGTRGGDRSHKGRSVARSPRRELAFAPAGAAAVERSGRDDQEGTTRPGHVRRAPRLRVASVRTGEPHGEACPATRQPLVHRGSRRQARARADDPDAFLGKERNGCLDLRCGRDGGACVPPGAPRGSSLRGPHEREGHLADAKNLHRGHRPAGHRAARSAANDGKALPCRRRGTGADPVVAWPLLSSDDRANFEGDRLAAAILLTRAAIETTAALWFLLTKLSKAVNAGNIENVDHHLMRLVMGNKTWNDPHREGASPR